jgi:hypothetical protein
MKEKIRDEYRLVPVDGGLCKECSTEDYCTKVGICPKQWRKLDRRTADISEPPPHEPEGVA